MSSCELPVRVTLCGMVGMRSERTRTKFVGLLTALSLASCSEKSAPRPPDHPLDIPSSCVEGTALACSGGSAVRCLDGGVEIREDCGDAGLSCDPDYGCVACRPSYYTCEANTVYLCADDGRSRTLVEKCPAGTQCSPGGCKDLCAEAEKTRSYLGCDYWPTFTPNSQLDPTFKPALVVANPNLVPAEIRIEKGGAAPISEMVPPESAKTVMLEFDAALKGRPTLDDGSVLVKAGAYHLVSSVPVTVHQFNPLLYEVSTDCLRPDNDPDRNDMRCNSYTNDASLLLPAHVLLRESGEGVSYLGLSRSTWITEFVMAGERAAYPGFLAITAAGDRMVNVRVKSKSHTRASDDGTLPALAPGDEADAALMPGDVLVLRSATPPDCPGQSAMLQQGSFEIVVCDPGADWDLTGSEIEADGPVQVIGGHDCTYVPYDVPACDHLEESLIPLETWGREAVVTRPLASERVSQRIRVVSGADANKITFSPAEVHAPVTLARGAFVELATDLDVVVRGEKQLAVAQYLEGQGGTRDSGDPSLSLAIPVDQFRDSYYFVSPDSYDADYVNVIVRRGAEIYLDGELVGGFEPVAADFEVARIALDRAGQHEIHGRAGEAFGIVLYGYGAYTSYMLPGGLDLQIIGNPL